MKKSLPLIPVVAALAVWSSPAAADPIPKGTIALGAERLTGFYHSRESIDHANGNEATTRDKFTLLGQTTDGPWDLPRIGIDGFIIDGLSLGGTLAIMHTGITAKDTTLGVTGSRDSSSFGVLFAPRVGYGLMFSERIGFWPRGGFSYYVQTNSFDNAALRSVSVDYFSLNIDAPFLFKLAPNFAITAGPTIDIGITGSQKNEFNGAVTTNYDAGYFGIGIAAGLLALL